MKAGAQPVVVTGSAGRIGRAVTRELGRSGFGVRPFDRSPTPGFGHAGGDSLLDRAGLDRVMAGAGALVHLAATPQDEDFDGCLVPDNVTGLERVLEAARRAGVGRWVLASSIQMNLRQSREGPWPVRLTDAPSPLRWYAATKALLESAGYSYARDLGIPVVALRLGWCPRDAAQVAEIGAEEIAQDTYLSPGDAGRVVRAALEAPLEPGFHVLFATSRPVRREVFDLAPSRRLLGWEPEERWPEGATDWMRG